MDKEQRRQRIIRASIQRCRLCYWYCPEDWTKCRRTTCPNRQLAFDPNLRELSISELESALMAVCAECVHLHDEHCPDFCPFREAATDIPWDEKAPARAVRRIRA